MKTLVFSPQYNEEERKSGLRLVNFLSAAGLHAHCSFLDARIAEGINAAAIHPYDIPLLARLSLALDIHNILNSDCVVGILDGEDEGVLVKLGIAYILGISVYLFKNDVRATFAAGENSMVLGLSPRKPFSDAKKLKDALIKRRGEKCKPAERLSAVIEDLAKLGGEVKKHLNAGLAALAERFRESPALARFKAAETGELAAFGGGRVYCSGPLFSPCEHREMQKIANIFEAEGVFAYLPQRDGAEPFIIGSMAGPLAGSLLVKPFLRKIHDVIFCVDVKELLSSDYFICNLNGRFYDEGAMVEAGMAFAAGKPIALYLNDLRGVFIGGVHTVLAALSPLPPAQNAEMLTLFSARAAAAYDGKDSGFEAEGMAAAAAQRGAKYLKLLSSLKKPENKMLGWLEGCDEKE
ncbi:MAG TPA: nucleoside 2-deoxyribosyltransferase [Clostridia bacterium]|nr:nucleoside 2-deoxyribosyltransferase [Clostridia bacterium]